MVAFLYGAVIVKESLKVPNESNKKDKTTENQVENIDPLSKDCISIIWRSLLYILEGFRTVVTPREGWRRALVLLGVFQYICYICVYNGTEGSHRLYFVENKYKWTEEELTTFLFIFNSANWFGLWLIVPLLTNIAKISESSVAIIAVLTSATGYILPVFTDTEELVRSGSFILNWFSFGGFIALLSPVCLMVNR